MRSVSRFEANLLHVVQGLLGRIPPAQALPFILRPLARPKCLGRPAVELVQEQLAKGTVLLLAASAWPRERFLRESGPRGGRLWERTSPTELGLRFSPNTLDFLIWLTSADPLRERQRWQPAHDRPLTLGDRLVLVLAYQAVRNTQIGPLWARRQPFAGDGLCRLLFPDDFGESRLKLDFAPWLSGTGACVVEAWQAKLAARWIEVEREKSRSSAVERVLQIGASQTKALETFLAAADQAGRRDLARFVLMAARDLLRSSRQASDWLGSVKLDGLRLADRAETYRAALALPRQLETLSAWQRQALATGYFDEGYAASQLWKSDWEAYNGSALCEAARALVRQTELGGPA